MEYHCCRLHAGQARLCMRSLVTRGSLQVVACQCKRISGPEECGSSFTPKEKNRCGGKKKPLAVHRGRLGDLLRGASQGAANCIRRTTNGDGQLSEGNPKGTSAQNEKERWQRER